MKFTISYDSTNGPVKNAEMPEGDLGSTLSQVFDQNGAPSDGHATLTITAENGDSVKLVPNKPNIDAAIAKGNAFENNEAAKRLTGRHTRAARKAA